MQSLPRPRIRLAHRLSTPGWAVYTGVLLGLSFPPLPLYGLALVALVPMLARWADVDEGWVLFRETYVAFLLFVAVAGYWVVLHTSPSKAVLCGVGLLVLPALMALPVVGSALVRQRLGRGAGLAALASGWLALELLLLRGPLPVPWFLLGHTQATALPFNQFADLTGVAGLSLWVLAVNAVAFGAIEARPLAARFALGLVVVALLAAPLGYRAWRLTVLEPPEASLQVDLVQPALPPSRWDAVADAERVGRLSALTDEALAASEGAPPDLVVWPEGALPVFPDPALQRTLYERLGRWIASRDVPVLAGAVTRFDTAPSLTVEPLLARRAAAARPYYNSALLFHPARAPQQYDKVRVVPTADRVPAGGRVWEDLGVVGAGTFAPGARRTLFEASGVRFSTLISYEALFGDHARRMARDGAEFLAVLTNAGWWGRAPASQQQLALARLRAVETRRAVAVVSASGHTGLIEPDGSAGEALGWMRSGVARAAVPIRSGMSFYARHGDWLYFLGALVAGAFAVAWGISRLFFTRAQPAA